MQTPAEKELVAALCDFIRQKQTKNTVPLLVNIGAGQSVSIEKQLTDGGCSFVCDRIDVDDCRVKFPAVRHCWTCSAETMMKPLKSGKYSAAFANYVLEHVQDIPGMCREIYRILKPSGLFIASIPNPSAPEFIVSRHTPLWFHKKVRQEDAWETHYQYTIEELVKIFESRGFVNESVQYWPFIYGYLWRYPVAGTFSRLYDRLVAGMKMQRWMGDVCAVFRKP
jgi:SAM-dependent methyltransferase